MEKLTKPQVNHLSCLNGELSQLITYYSDYFNSLEDSPLKTLLNDVIPDLIGARLKISEALKPYTRLVGDISEKMPECTAAEKELLLHYFPQIGRSIDRLPQTDLAY